MPDVCFIYNYIVRPEYRKRGIGKAMWTQMIQSLNERKIVLTTGLSFNRTAYCRFTLSESFPASLLGRMRSDKEG